MLELAPDDRQRGLLKMRQGLDFGLVERQGDGLRCRARGPVGQHAPGLLVAPLHFGTEGVQVWQEGAQIEPPKVVEALPQALHALDLVGRQVEELVPVMAVLQHLEAVLLGDVQDEMDVLLEIDVLQPHLPRGLGHVFARYAPAERLEERLLVRPDLARDVLEVANAGLRPDEDADQNHDQRPHPGLGDPQHHDLMGFARFPIRDLPGHAHHHAEGDAGDDIEVLVLPGAAIGEQEERYHRRGLVRPALLGEQGDQHQARGPAEDRAHDADHAPVERHPPRQKIDRERADRGPIGLLPPHVERDRVDDDHGQGRLGRFHDALEEVAMTVGHDPLLPPDAQVGATRR